MEEQWRDIVIEKNGVIYDYSGIYQVSNYGRVRSLKFNKIKIMKLKKDSHGYIEVGLRKNGEKQQRFRVNRLVAIAFILNDDPENKTEVNHISEIKTQNDMWNLEWVTPKQNVNHGTRIERIVKKKSKRVICVETGEVFESTRDANRKTGLNHASICQCCNGKQKTCGKLHWKYYNDYLIEQLIIK